MHLTYDVIVVGSGFSAIAVTCNLIEQLPASAKVAVVGDDLVSAAGRPTGRSSISIASMFPLAA